MQSPATAKAVDITAVSAYGGGRSSAASVLGGSASYESEIAYKPGTRYKVDRVEFGTKRDGKKTAGQVWVVCTVLGDDD